MAQLPLPGNTADVLIKLPLWKSILDPVIATPVIQGNLISNVSLVLGSNVINHKLGRMQVGWILIDQQASVSIYRSQPFNKLTLTLTASAAAVVSLWCF